MKLYEGKHLIEYLIEYLTRNTDDCEFWVWNPDTGFCTSMTDCDKLAPPGTCDECVYGQPECSSLCGVEGKCIGLLVFHILGRS